MTFWELFFRVLPYRPVQALAAAYWHVTRRRVRASNCLKVACAHLPFTYDIWISRFERSALSTDSVRAQVRGWPFVPSFSVVIYDAERSTPELRKRSIQSVERQPYPNWKLGDESGERPLWDMLDANDDYVIPLQAGDELSENALFHLAEAAVANPRPSILYGDEDELDEFGNRRCPWFKPRWNQELFFAQDYLSKAIAIESNLVQGVAECRETICELVIKATLKADRPIIHVPHIMTHARSAPIDQVKRLPLLGRYLESKGATCSPGPFETVRVTWPLPQHLPRVSIIVPTRDKLTLLRPCLESVLNKTEYPNFEILVLDNESAEPATLNYLQVVAQDERVTVVRFPGPYNFSTFNNFAASQVNGDHICLLNNDTEVLEPGWLTEMMRYAARPEVGAVGAKLLYDDGTIQHAGVVIGLGDAAGHAHRFQPAHEPGYFRLAHLTQFVSAVTAACLVVEKKKFEAVGGLDEHLGVAFNDVDLCLKLEAAGWRNVYVPHAVLVHHESKSRPKDSSPDQYDRYMRELGLLQDRWRTRTYSDPLHSPNLDRYSETFVIKL